MSARHSAPGEWSYGRVPGDQPGQIHRFAVPGVVKVERKLVILLDALLDLLQVRYLNAKEGLLHTVVGHYVLVAVAAQRLPALLEYLLRS